MWSYIYSWFYPEPPTKQVIYEKTLLTSEDLYYDYDTDN